MNKYIKRNAWVAATLIGCFVLALSAQAASFDCGKASTKVEHITCDNSEISKLDDELSVAYKAAVQDKQQADSVRQAQKQWMKVRNGCSDAGCVRQAYEVQLTKLAASDGKTKKHGAEQGASNTDDYVLDPAPREMIDWNLEAYKKPEDKNVCALYLQNLQYFARRSEPLSCGQPIAPMLQGKIKPAEWENLDPDQYPELFKAAIKEAFHLGPDESVEEEIKWRKKDVKEHAMVFRRLKFDLKGSPGVEVGSNQPLPEQEYSIVQYGNDITGSENPDRGHQCQPKAGRTAASIGATYHSPRLFVAAKNLNSVFGEILDWRGWYIQKVWLINNRIYGESYDERGDVKLTQLRVNYPVSFEAVCLFHFKQATNKE